MTEVDAPLLHGHTEGNSFTLNGLDFETLLKRSQIDIDAPQISVSQHILLMLNSIDMTGDEAHGLGGGPLNRGFASLGLRTMLSTGSFGPALGVLSRYFSTCSRIFELEVNQDQDLAYISFRTNGQRSERSAILEKIWFDALYAFFSWFVGRRLPVYANAPNLDAHSIIYRAHWSMAAPRTLGEASSICVPRSCLEWKRDVEQVEEPLWEALRFWIDSTAPESWAPPSQLNGLFGKALAPAQLRMRESSEAKLLSQRQQARVIKRLHGANFRDLRGDALVDMATHLLRETNAPIETIAMHLGYAEERSFRRFTRNRTGLTPSQIRKQGLGRGYPPADIISKIHALTRKMDS